MLEHISELKTRLIRCGILLGIAFACSFFCANRIYELISAPILAKIPNNVQLVTTQVTAPFMVPIQLSFLVMLLLCAPYIIHQIWMFIKPGLYPKERRAIAPLIIFSILLFYIGVAFAWFIICPVALKFFTSSAPNGVTVMLDIADYIDFIVTIACATGIAFQIPVVIRILLKTQIVTKQQLISKRKHVIVLALIIGMILAPPDVLSQLLLAIPMWLLFEFGLFTSLARH